MKRLFLILALLLLASPAEAQITGLASGGTGSNLSGTGGSHQFLKQSGAGAAISVGTIADGDLPSTVSSKTINSSTLNGPTLQGTVSAGTGLTMPAFTMAGQLDLNGQSLLNLGPITFGPTITPQFGQISLTATDNQIQYTGGTLRWPLSGSSKTVTLLNQSGTVMLYPSGGTTNFSNTGGTSQVVQQTTSAGAFTVARLAASDLSDTATSSYVLRGNGTSFVSARLAASDLSDTATLSYVLRGNGTSFVSAQLAASDLSNGTTGTGSVVLATAPQFTTGIGIGGAAGTGNSVKVYGTTSGSITLKVPATAGSNTLTLPAGTTDFSATGGTSQVVQQTTLGGAFTVAQLAASDLSNGTTGSGNLALATAPTFVTSITDPLVIGGTGVSSTLTLKGTSNATPSSANVFVNSAGGGSLVVGTATTAGINDGDVLVPNSNSYRFLNSAGTSAANFGITSSSNNLQVNVSAAGANIQFGYAGAVKINFLGEQSAAGMELTEMSAAPAAAAANGAKLYAIDNGAGKTQLVVIFNTGAAQVLATQP